MSWKRGVQNMKKTKLGKHFRVNMSQMQKRWRRAQKQKQKGSLTNVELLANFDHFVPHFESDVQGCLNE